MIHGIWFAIGAAVFGWQVYGWLGGLAAFVAVVLLTMVCNFAYLAWISNSSSEDGDPMVAFQRIKWGVFLVVMAVIALSGLEIRG